MTVHQTSPHVRDATSRIKVPINPCVEPSACATLRADHRYRVRLAITSSLCGSGFGEGCEPPAEVYAVVTMLARLTQVPRARSGVGAWEVGPPTTW